MRTINNGIRKTVIKITRIIVWSELAADLVFFAFFYFTDGLTRSVPSYIVCDQYGDLHFFQKV